MTVIKRKYVRRYGVAMLLLFLLQGCTPSYSYKENAVPETVKLSERLQKLFSKTKLVCFGRYALEVPLEAQLVMGPVWFPAGIEVIDGGLDASKRRGAADVKKIKWENNAAEIIYSGKGPIESSWQIRYYEGKYSTEYGSLNIKTYANKGELTFIVEDMVSNDTNGKSDSEDATAARQAMLVKNMRLRVPDEIPTEPGFCISHGFIPEKLYDGQEMSSAGLYLPSLPDITFSIHSNKDAYGDYPPADFDKLRHELSMLTRIEEAKKDQGASYPSRTLLREGKRDVQHWHGEESLIKRNDGVHDFEWAFVGTPRDVANPSEFSVHMYTKVEHNTVGAAKTVSVSDGEAVALWDKLLSGLKFRVKVPGAPEGSYFTHAEKTSAQPPAR